jgi:HNH endonuclease
MRKVRVEGSCWIFTGAKTPRGYGKISDHGAHVVYAHRLMFEQVSGISAAGKVVMHSCDRPSCVNPDHLRLGSQKENLADARAKGRLAFDPHVYRCTSQV